MDVGPVKHDPELCGISPETSCPKCRPFAVRLQVRQAQVERLREIEERMAKAGIDLNDFADLVWIHLQPSLEKEVKEIMLRTIGMALRDLKIVSRIEGMR